MQEEVVDQTTTAMQLHYQHQMQLAAHQQAAMYSPIVQGYLPQNPQQIQPSVQGYLPPNPQQVQPVQLYGGQFDTTGANLQNLQPLHTMQVLYMYYLCLIASHN